MHLVEILQQVGLSKRTAKVYLACLELGPASISDIAKKANIKRPTVYLAMEELLNRKLVYRVVRGKSTLYHAEHPRKILNQCKSNLSQIEKIMPELEARYKHPLPKPRIRFYEGKEGLKMVYQEIASSSSRVLASVSIERFFRVFSEKEAFEIFELAQKNKTRFSDLVEQSRAAEKYAKAKYRKGLGPIKSLPSGFKLSTDVLVYNNKVAMISFDNLVAIVIEDQGITETQKKFLKFLWKGL